MSLAPFHLSIPVVDLDTARAFYGDLLGCAEGRSRANRIDFSFFGHHLVVHVEPEEASHVSRLIPAAHATASVRHFGVILEPAAWHELADRLKTAPAARFIVPPKLNSAGKITEQLFMMLDDGSGNTVEFKGQPAAAIFAREREAVA